MWNFAEQPGQLYVVATLLPLASFLVILLASAVRSALRQSAEGTLGWGLYQMLGGDRPPRWPALLATLAIGGACVLTVIGFVRLQGDHHQIEELQAEITQVGRLHRDLLKRPNNETPDQRKQRLVRAKDAKNRL